MLDSNALSRVLSFGALALFIAGCSSHPPPPRHPGPYKTPADAFNSVQAPYDPTGGPKGGDQPLAEDIAHLQSAREAYQHSKALQRARTQDEQARCRQQPNAHLVHIQDGSGDSNAVYCELPATPSARAADQQDKSSDN